MFPLAYCLIRSRRLAPSVLFLIEDTAVDVDHRTHEYERTKSSEGWSTTKE